MMREDVLALEARRAALARDADQLQAWIERGNVRAHRMLEKIVAEIDALDRVLAAAKSAA